MRLKILGSSSSGNCYILQNDAETLIIECGVKIDKIKQGLNFNTRKVVGCLISHEHQDHCKAVNEVMKAGIKVFATEGTFKGMKVDSSHHKAFVINPEIEFSIGSFRILPFDIQHDAEQPVGFLINHAETGTVLFLTDTYYVKKKFSKLNNVIVEANYSDDIIDAKVAEGASSKFLRDRVFRSHMSLKTCKDLLHANDLSRVNNIILIHLSDTNSDASRFKKEVEEATGKIVTIAEAGLEISFNKTSF